MIRRFSEVNKYQSASNLLKEFQDLITYADIEHFKTELTKYKEGLGENFEFIFDAQLEMWNGAQVPASYLLLTENLKTPSKDILAKIDWYLSVSKNPVVEYLLNKSYDPATNVPLYKNISQDVKALLEKHGFDFNELTNNFGYIRDRFEFQGFTVFNAGLQEKSLKRYLADLSEIIQTFKKKNFQHLLYGDLVILTGDFVGQIMDVVQGKYTKVNASAFYDIAKDRVLVNGGREPSVKTFAHELGHRQYFKKLSPTQRQTWDAKFLARGYSVPESIAKAIYLDFIRACPTVTDDLGNSYSDMTKINRRKFLSKIVANPDKYNALSYSVLHFSNEDIPESLPALLKSPGVNKWIDSTILLDGYYIDVLKKALRFATYVNHPEQSGWEGENISENFRRKYEDKLAEIQDFERSFTRALTNISVPPTSTTEYGRTNASEDYAEAFAAYITNSPMPENIMQEFIRLHNIRVAKKK